jgi:hypothetical protein
MKDITAINTAMVELDKVIKRSNDKASKEEKEVLEKALEQLKTGSWIKDGTWVPSDVSTLNKHLVHDRQTSYLPCKHLNQRLQGSEKQVAS